MFNQIDLYIALTGLVLIALGFMTGFLRSILSVAWVYICIYISSGIGPTIVSAFSFLSVEESQVGKVIMTLAIFVIIYLIGELILAMLKNLISISILGPIDKVLGGVAAGFKALLIAGFVLATISTLNLSEDALRLINTSTLKDWSIKVYRATYPMAMELGGRAGDAIAGKTNNNLKIEPSKVVDLKVVTAEAGKIVETVRRVIP